MGNDFFSHSSTNKKHASGSNTVLTVSSEIQDLANSRENALNTMAKQIASFVINTNDHSTKSVRSSIESLLVAAKLSDADTKELLIQVLTIVAANV